MSLLPRLLRAYPVLSLYAHARGVASKVWPSSGRAPPIRARDQSTSSLPSWSALCVILMAVMLSTSLRPLIYVASLPPRTRDAHCINCFSLCVLCSSLPQMPIHPSCNPI